MPSKILKTSCQRSPEISQEKDHSSLKLNSHVRSQTELYPIASIYGL